MLAHRQFEIAVAGALDERVSIQAILEGDVELQLFPVGIDDGVRGENAGLRESGAVLAHPSDEGVVIMVADRQFELSVAGPLDERVSIQAILEGYVELQLFPVGIDDSVRGENAGRRESGAVLVHPSDKGVVVFGRGRQGEVAIGGIHGGSDPLIVEGYHIHFFPSSIQCIIGGNDRGAAVGYRTVLVGPANELIAVFCRFRQVEFLAVDIAVANFCGPVHQH